MDRREYFEQMRAHADEGGSITDCQRSALEAWEEGDEDVAGQWLDYHDLLKIDEHDGKPWQPIDTIPPNQPVIVESISGIICPAIVRTYVFRPADDFGPQRINCIRLDHHQGRGVVAIRWHHQ